MSTRLCSPHPPDDSVTRAGLFMLEGGRAWWYPKLPQVRRNGQAIWKLGRSGQLALFEVCGDHLQFFHLMIQEYLAAVHVFTLLERGEKFPMWLHDEDEFALGTHHFFGALCAQRSFGIKAYIDEAEAASVRGNLLRLLRRAFVVNDRFAIEGLFNLFKLMRID
eukprot:402711-Amphidinium_carterae.1